MEANYHINKDWGGGSYGDGLMYTAKLARDGTLYLTRAMTDLLWAATNANPYGIWVCVDASTGSPLTAAQKAVLPLVEAEFMKRVGRKLDVSMHGLLVSAGNSTQCAGPEILAYLKATGRAQVR